MQSIIAVFGNRSSALQFASALKRLYVRNKIIDTPRDLSVACGISVVFDGKHLRTAKTITQRLMPNAAIKFYLVTNEPLRKYLPVK